MGVLGLALLACERNGPPPTVPTLVVPVGSVAGAPLAHRDGSGPSAAPARILADGRNPGDRVDVEWHGSWYPAVLLERRAEGWLVHFEDYGEEWDEVVVVSRVRDRTVHRLEEDEIAPDSDP